MERSVSPRERVRRYSCEAADGVEREFAAGAEAKTLVEGDRCGVVGGDVEIGAQVGGAVSVEQIGEKGGRVASATEFGQSAEAADFVKVGFARVSDVHAFAAHGNQAAGVIPGAAGALRMPK